MWFDYFYQGNDCWLESSTAAQEAFAAAVADPRYLPNIFGGPLPSPIPAPLAAAEPAKGGDLDDVVEPEWQYYSAGRGRTAGSETPRAVRALVGGEQPVPTEGAEAEAPGL